MTPGPCWQPDGAACADPSLAAFDGRIMLVRRWVIRAMVEKRLSGKDARMRCRAPVSAWIARVQVALVIVALVLVTLSIAACSLTGGTLGGRERCWTDARAASLWRGVLRIDASGARLDTPEGDVIPLIAGALQTRIDEGGVGRLVRGDDVVATAGDDVTLFGGAGSDGALVMCSVEEVHAS